MTDFSSHQGGLIIKVFLLVYLVQDEMKICSAQVILFKRSLVTAQENLGNTTIGGILYYSKSSSKSCICFHLWLIFADKENTTGLKCFSWLILSGTKVTWYNGYHFITLYSRSSITFDNQYSPMQKKCYLNLYKINSILILLCDLHGLIVIY